MAGSDFGAPGGAEGSRPGTDDGGTIEDALTAVQPQPRPSDASNVAEVREALTARQVQPHDVSPDTNALDVARRRPADTAGEPVRRDRAAEVVLEPSRSRFPSLAVWSRRYTASVAVADVVVAMLAVLVTLPIVDIPFTFAKMVVLVVGAGAAWPVAVAISRGYERSSIGVGDDELRAVLRAVVFAVAVGSVPAAITESLGVVATSVIAVPLAGVGSIVVRFAARKVLHRQQRQ